MTDIPEISGDLEREIEAYAASLPYTLPSGSPFLRTRTGHEYTKARLIDDFDRVRKAAFGKAENRRFQDIRRSANVEADLGGASPEERAAILANNLHRDQFLEETYTPSTVAKSRKIMEARLAGRALLSGERRNAPLSDATKVVTGEAKSNG